LKQFIEGACSTKRWGVVPKDATGKQTVRGELGVIEFSKTSFDAFALILSKA
jgi:hypothetical protein